MPNTSVMASQAFGYKRPRGTGYLGTINAIMRGLKEFLPVIVVCVVVPAIMANPDSGVIFDGDQSDLIPPREVVEFLLIFCDQVQDFSTEHAFVDFLDDDLEESELCNSFEKWVKTVFYVFLFSFHLFPYVVSDYMAQIFDGPEVTILIYSYVVSKTSNVLKYTIHL